MTNIPKEKLRDLWQRKIEEKTNLEINQAYNPNIGRLAKLEDLEIEIAVLHKAIIEQERFEQFDERSAWFFALKAIKRLNLLSQIKMVDLQKLYVSALRSYGHSYHKDVRRE